MVDMCIVTYLYMGKRQTVECWSDVCKERECWSLSRLKSISLSRWLADST